MNFPYSDSDMIYDYNSHRYILTKEFVFKSTGEDLDKLLKKPQAVNAVLNRVSVLVYAYIHKHNANTLMQDFIIAKTKGGRDIIKNAMLLQMITIALTGDWSLSSDNWKRENWIDITAKEELLKTLPEIGTTILYTGTLRFCTKDLTEW